MMALAIDFVAGTLSHLPDFFADRATTSYDDSPQAFKPGDWPIRLGVHPIGQTTAEIAFRDGRETDDPAVTNARSKSAPRVSHPGENSARSSAWCSPTQPKGSSPGTAGNWMTVIAWPFSNSPLPARSRITW
ncbi:MAG: hypothetical protein WB561_10995 [Terracidiphilus sp.]